MKTRTNLTVAVVAIFLIVGLFQIQTSKEKEQTLSREFVDAQTKPDEWMYNMRAYPNNHIDVQAFQNGVKQRKEMIANAANRSVTDWEPVGPNNIGGRITDIAYHPTDPSIIYAGSAVGGIFKSIDGGANWNPIFDDANSASIGNIAIAPSNPNILFAGTGEANGSASSGAFFGDGIYKSTDAGNTWEHSGLDNSQHIGRVVVDPSNSDRVYAAVAGLLYGKSDEKGLYRTLDGGASWENILFLSDSTSCIDVVINPENADIIYAAMWERTRFPWNRNYGGTTSGIWRSTDGGSNWEQLLNGLPPSDEETGRIGLAIAASNPNILYASFTTNSVTNSFDGIYKTNDGGDTWGIINDDIDDVYSSFGWYFGQIRVNPNDPEDLFVLGVPIYRSLNGGVSFQDVTGNMHVDFHALEYHPVDQNKIIIGCDGGINISENNGASFSKVQSLPNMQFYNCEIDESVPNRYFGGAQDNGTNVTFNGDPDGYEGILGGDGFHVAVNPINSNFVYAEFQFGNFFRSTDGGNYFDWAMNGIDFNERTNWNTPFILDHANPTHLYMGRERLYKTTNSAESWEAISQDLTKGEHSSGSQAYGTILTVAVAPTDNDYILVGTDDGNVQLTTDGGTTWNNVSAGLPNRAVSQVAFDPWDESVAYVTLSGYRLVDYMPHVLRSTDFGQTWEDISGNLPEVPVNDIVIDPLSSSTLIIANDIGVFITYNDGDEWEILGTGLPLTVTCDLRFHEPTRKLLVATFGRSMYTYQLEAPVSTFDLKTTTTKPLKVYPNPLVEEATISFDLEKGGKGKLEILDITGRVLHIVESGNYPSGLNQIAFTRGEVLPGNYVFRLKVGNDIFIGKAIIQ